MNTKFTDKKHFTQQVKIHKIWRRISVFFVFAGKHLRKCFSVLFVGSVFISDHPRFRCKVTSNPPDGQKSPYRNL